MTTVVCHIPENYPAAYNRLDPVHSTSRMIANLSDGVGWQTQYFLDKPQICENTQCAVDGVHRASQIITVTSCTYEDPPQIHTIIIKLYLLFIFV